MFLRNIWYFALPSRDVKAGKLVHKKLLGEPVLFGRKKSGEIFALRDLCPHRGVPLSAGRLLHPGDQTVGETMDTDQVECPYHGWRFNTEGNCTSIPSLVEGQNVDLEKIKVQRYHLEEKNGNVWIYMPETMQRPGIEQDTPIMPAPDLPGIDENAQPRMLDRMTFECFIDHAVIGLMDPAHIPYIHRQWWWRSAKSVHEKAKNFGPVERGFSMLPHKPSANSYVYKLFGGQRQTEIRFELPGLRTEYLRLGERHITGFTAVTPTNATKTTITIVMYWDVPVMAVVPKFLVSNGIRTFVGQDRDAVNAQQVGLAYDPQLMLIHDADVQAKWYFKLKQAWKKHRETGEPFRNPVRPATLRWRS